MFWPKWTLTLPLITLISIVQEIDCLQCFNCHGISDYDPQNCFDPSFGETILQECRRDEQCEKKITKIDQLQTVVERGCSSNCDGRTFIWNEDFQVLCCGENRCNTASATLSSTTAISIASICVLIWNRHLW